MLVACGECACSRPDDGPADNRTELDAPLITTQPAAAHTTPGQSEQSAKQHEQRKQKKELFVRKLARQNCASLAHLLLVVKKETAHSKQQIGEADWAQAAVLRSKSDPNESKLRVLARMLRTQLRPRMHRIRFSEFEKSLCGKEILDWLVKHNEAADRKGALVLAQKLMEQSDLTPANSHDMKFRDGQKHLYQMATATKTTSLPEDVSVAVVDWQEGYATDTQRPSFVQYKIEVNAAGQQWILSKRYREFAILHKKLHRICPSGLPTLPRKHAGLSSSTTTTKNKALDRAMSKTRKWDLAFLESRKESLDFYIRAVSFVAAAQPQLAEVVLAFLDDEHVQQASDSNYADL